MHRAAWLILVSIVAVAVLSVALAVVPERTAQAQVRLARALGLRTAPSAALTPRGILASRLAGVTYLVLCSALLVSMRFSVGPIQPVHRSCTAQAPGGLCKLVEGELASDAKAYPGLIVISLSGEEQAVSTFGRLRLGSAEPPQAGSVFEIGSLTKVFTATLLARAVESGRLGLDTPLVAAWPPAATVPGESVRAIRLRHLVTHTSGLPRLPVGSFRPDRLWRGAVAGNSYAGYGEADLLATLRRGIRSAPGSRYAYSNVGFGILGLALAHSAGVSLEELFESDLAGPLGLADTRFRSGPASVPAAAGHRLFVPLGRVAFAQLADPWEFPPALASAGGLRSTSRDMLRFLRALSGRDSTALAAALRAAQAPLFASPEVEIGMAWLRRHTPGGGQALVWHDGATGGFSSFVGMSEDGGAAVAILSNCSRPVDGLGFRLLARLHSGLQSARRGAS